MKSIFHFGPHFLIDFIVMISAKQKTKMVLLMLIYRNYVQFLTKFVLKALLFYITEKGERAAYGPLALLRPCLLYKLKSNNTV